MVRLILNFLLVGFLLAGHPGPSIAKTYKFKDENGKLHFTNDPTKVPERYRKDSNDKLAKPNFVRKGISESKVYKKNCVPSKNQYTALHAAANNNKVSEARLLLANGAELEGQDHSCYTPLHRAVFSNNFEMVEFLLSKGANPNVVGSSNWAMPLTSAINIHKIELVKLLLKHGADINATTVRNKSTPLMYAVEFEGVRMVQLLIDNGADVSIRNSKGLTPLKVAREKGKEKVVELLKSHGAKD